MYIAAIDIGGTKTEVAILDAGLTTQQHVTLQPTSRNPTVAMAQLSMGLNGFYHLDYDIAAAGVCGPALSRNDIFAPRLSTLPDWGGFDLRSELERTIYDITRETRPMVFENDVNAAALGAYLFDNHKFPATSRFLHVRIGTGLGAGYIVPDAIGGYSIYAKADGKHPKFGHRKNFIGRTSGKRNVMCGCGVTNCPETYASGVGLEKRYNVDARNAQVRVRNEVAWNLAKAIYLFARGFEEKEQPTLISLGGGVVEGWGNSFRDKLNNFLEHFFPENRPIAELCGVHDVGLRGAGVLAMKSLGLDPNLESRAQIN